MYKSVTDIKPNYINDIANALRSVAYSVGATMHPEFLRALVAIGLQFGIGSGEIENAA